MAGHEIPRRERIVIHNGESPCRAVPQVTDPVAWVARPVIFDRNCIQGARSLVELQRGRMTL